MKRRWGGILLAFVALSLLGLAYVRTHPLVFLQAHAHCIKWAGLSLHQYADQHEGRFPAHPKGYGNALLLMDEDCFQALTGPGYDAAVLRDAKRAGADLPEEACGRVYIQGLRTKSNSEIAILFDKLPTPGGDHCHLPNRLWAPLGREVCFVDSHMAFISETNWPQFVQRQVELLAEEGFDRQEAERLFASKPK
jgi:hypothetical protein